MKEEWKDIEGYEGRYQVSTLGRVRSLTWTDSLNRLHRERVLKFGKNHAGYLMVCLLREDGKKFQKAIHRIVAGHFLLNTEDCNQVNHKNGVKTDNSISNLEWVTAKENTQHAIKLGLAPMAVKNNPRSKEIEQYTQNGRLVNRYPSIQEASRQTGFYASYICEAAHGKKRKSYKTFIWKFI